MTAKLTATEQAHAKAIEKLASEHRAELARIESANEKRLNGQQEHYSTLLEEARADAKAARVELNKTTAEHQAFSDKSEKDKLDSLTKHHGEITGLNTRLFNLEHELENARKASKKTKKES